MLPRKVSRLISLPTLKQERERIIGSSATGARQPQERVALAHRLTKGPGAPKRIEFHRRIMATGRPGNKVSERGVWSGAWRTVFPAHDALEPGNGVFPRRER